MQNLSVEASAIVAATAPDVVAKSAAITIRMWHELADDAARSLLFAEFTVDGRQMGLVEAVAAFAGVRGRTAVPRPIVSGPIVSTAQYADLIEPAFLRSLAGTIDGLATPAVLNAWKHAFRALTTQFAS